MGHEVEIERTFLAASMPLEIDGVKSVAYEDTYIPEGASYAVLRIRMKGDQHEITKKTPVVEGDFSSHDEHTVPLSREEYKALRSSSSMRVSKDRYTVAINGFEAEVDVFTGPLEGLVLLDFEFTSEDEANAFTPPDCCLVDVTQEKIIHGGQLAGKSYDDIADWLQQQGYRKIT